MDELKIVKHITYTYETSDGTEFANEQEAKEWQKHLSAFEKVCVLDRDYKPTTDICRAVYVYAKTKEQAESFNAMVEAQGYSSTIDGTGWFRYDDISDSYVDIELEIEKLQHIIDMLNKGGESDA